MKMLAAQPAISGGGVQVGTYGDFEFAFLTLQFEVPKYPILEDEDMVNCATARATISSGGTVAATVITNGGSGYAVAPQVVFSPPPSGGHRILATGTAIIAGGAVTGISLTNAGNGYLEPPTITISPSPSPEYLRNHFWTPEVNLETQARKGETWYFCQPNIGQTTFPGDRLLRQPKGVIKITGYQIHEDYVLLGKLVPSNYEHRIGTVNSRPFPFVAYPDQNKATGTLVQRVPGTCLLMAPKITPSAMVHPAVLAGEISPNLFPRNVDVETTILVFDPPSIDTTTIDLSGTDRYGFPYNGSSTTLVRGHNLQPLVIPFVFPLAWDSATPYVIDDLVTHGARVYDCILGNTNHVPPNATYWTDVGPAKLWSWFAGSKASSNLYTMLAVPYIPLRGAGFATPPTSDQQKLLTMVQQNAPLANINALLAKVYPVGLDGDSATLTRTVSLASIRLAIAQAIGQFPVTSDQQLLYPYGDLEQLWQSAESLTP